jgi:hypothetical protein
MHRLLSVTYRYTIAVAGSIVLASPAAAQKLLDIGKTSAGTPVFLETTSVSRANGIVTATVRVRLAPPIKHASGDLRSSRTIAMIDCVKQTVATKESWYYLDDAGKKVGMHKTVKLPGFGPSFKGSLSDVAMRHLCAAPPPR